jgi:hypothetical protein
VVRREGKLYTNLSRSGDFPIYALVARVAVAVDRATVIEVRR